MITYYTVTYSVDEKTVTIQGRIPVSHLQALMKIFDLEGFSHWEPQKGEEVLRLIKKEKLGDTT